MNSPRSVIHTSSSFMSWFLSSSVNWLFHQECVCIMVRLLLDERKQIRITVAPRCGFRLECGVIWGKGDLLVFTAVVIHLPGSRGLWNGKQLLLHNAHQIHQFVFRFELVCILQQLFFPEISILCSPIVQYMLVVVRYWIVSVLHPCDPGFCEEVENKSDPEVELFEIWLWALPWE